MFRSLLAGSKLMSTYLVHIRIYINSRSSAAVYRFRLPSMSDVQEQPRLSGDSRSSARAASGITAFWIVRKTPEIASLSRGALAQKLKTIQSYTYVIIEILFIDLFKGSARRTPATPAREHRHRALIGQTHDESQGDVETSQVLLVEGSDFPAAASRNRRPRQP
jgi:hypothetical protein